MDNRQQLEVKIRAYCDEHKSYRDDEQLEDLLYERQRVLDTHFEVTQEHLEQLNKMNAKLNNFTWNEVVLQYQNFGTYIKTKEKYCDIKI